MIAEALTRLCDRGYGAPTKQIAGIREIVRLCRAVVVGVAFFDFLHGQSGVAPNGIELHPILGFRYLA